MPDVQCPWQLLVQCAGPRCHHFIRNVPPEHSVAYAQGNDRGMREVMGSLLEGVPGNLCQRHEAEQLATLPMRMEDSVCIPHAAWRQRFVGHRGLMLFLCSRIDFPPLPSLCQINWSLMKPRVVWGLCNMQQRHWIAVASWADLHGNNCEQEFVLRLTQSLSLASGSMAGNTTRLPFSNTTFGRRQLLPSHLLRTKPSCVLIQDQEPVQFSAGHPQDAPSLRSRVVAPERTLARICREAGAVVRTNVLLRDMNITVSARDERKVEVLASGLPLNHGAQLAVDVTSEVLSKLVGRLPPTQLELMELGSPKLAVTKR